MAPISPDLVEQLLDNNVVIFTGAGLSARPGGLPNGAELAKELAHRAGIRVSRGQFLPEVAQSCVLRIGRHAVVNYIIDRFTEPGLVPLDSHKLIASLPALRIITTNWDNLQEEGLKLRGRAFIKIIQDDELPFFDSQKVALFKMHGSVERPDSIVVTADDYYDVFQRLPELANLFQSWLATSTFLFVGFGLGDQDFRLLHHRIVRAMGRHKRRSYAVQRTPTNETREYWIDKNVEVVAADAVDFLKSLRRRLSRAP